MEITFYKYQGCGNDFVMIYDKDKNLVLSTENILFLCNRHFGIGADGLIILKPSNIGDFEMQYFNSDGKESTMCGNGGRCAMAFANYLGLAKEKSNFNAIDGMHQAEIIAINKNEIIVNLKMIDVETVNDFIDYTTVNTGSPHYVKLVKNIEKFDVFNEGKKIRESEPFKEMGINVDFVEIKENYIFARTYERGVENETLACGTGVTAVALTLATKNLLTTKNKCNIKTLGGTLQVKFERNGNLFHNIWLEGAATMVFNGKIVI